MYYDSNIVHVSYCYK